MYYLLLLLSLTSCAAKQLPFDVKTEFSEVPRVTNNPIFDSYKVSFAKDCELNPIGIAIDFAKLADPAVGECWTWEEKKRLKHTIKIDQSYWDSADDNEKEWLIYHELGHCVKDLDHLEETFPDGSPTSIMASFIPENATYLLRDSRTYYISQLCNAEPN
jgi:hypothetical protein